MFFKRKEKVDRVQIYLDKVGVPEDAEAKLDGISLEDMDTFNLCSNVGNSLDVLAQFTIVGVDDGCILYFDPVSQLEKDKIKEICIETGIRYSVEKDVDVDLPEEVRLPPKWSVELPAKHWKKLIYLFMREVFGAENIRTLSYNDWTDELERNS